MQLSRSPHRRGLVKVGCAALLVIVVLAMAAGFWVALSWRGWAAEASRRTFAALIEKTGLPDEQKQGMIAHVDALTAEFEAGTVSLQDMAAVVEQVSRSPIIPAAVVAAMHEGYVRQSALSDEEKAEAKVVLRRYARGVYEKSIPESAIGPTLEPISAPRGDSKSRSGREARSTTSRTRRASLPMNSGRSSPTPRRRRTRLACRRRLPRLTSRRNSGARSMPRSGEGRCRPTTRNPLGAIDRRSTRPGLTHRWT